MGRLSTRGAREPEKRAEFPRCFRTLVVKIEKTNSKSTRDFSKRINFTRVDPFVWSTLVVKIKKTQECTLILGEHNFTTVAESHVVNRGPRNGFYSETVSGVVVLNQKRYPGTGTGVRPWCSDLSVKNTTGHEWRKGERDSRGEG